MNIAATSVSLTLPGLHGMRVLVVDDNRNAATVLVDILESIGFEVDCVFSGQIALASLSEADKGRRAYEFVLLDWQMPEMDGFECARRIGELDLTQKPKVLLVTAYGREEALSGAAKVGIQHVLVKPVNISLLVDTMMAAMGREQTTDRSLPETLSFAAYDDAIHARRGARVLLVEDNEINQQVASEILSDAGFVVVVAQDGQVALDRVAEAHAAGERYDIVLMDMQMPLMDGVTATRHLRQNPANAQLPIVAMTANAMEADRERCAVAGMNDFVTKPIEPSTLWRVLTQWIPAREDPSRVELPAEVGQKYFDLKYQLELLSGIKGLEVDQALRRVMGKGSLYVSLLGKFVKGQAYAMTSIETAINRGDMELAERTAHTLKGVAANIGATQLQAAAAELEHALRNQESYRWADVMSACATELGELLDQLTPRLLSQEAPARQNENVSMPFRFGDVCERLAQLIANDDADAVELMTTESALLRDGLGERYKSICEAVEVFDFAQAATLLQAANVGVHL